MLSYFILSSLDITYSYLKFYYQINSSYRGDCSHSITLYRRSFLRHHFTFFFHHLFSIIYSSQFIVDDLLFLIFWILGGLCSCHQGPWILHPISLSFSFYFSFSSPSASLCRWQCAYIGCGRGGWCSHWSLDRDDTHSGNEVYYYI